MTGCLSRLGTEYWAGWYSPTRTDLLLMHARLIRLLITVLSIHAAFGTAARIAATTSRNRIFGSRGCYRPLRVWYSIATTRSLNVGDTRT